MTLRSIRRLARCLLDELVDAGSRSSSSVACADPQTSGRQLVAVPQALLLAGRGHGTLSTAAVAAHQQQHSHGQPHAQPGTAQQIHLSFRSMTSLAKAGVPGPSPEASDALSQFYGGHIIRRMQLATTVLQLDDTLHEARRKLTPMHLSVAAAMLAKLARSGAPAGPSPHTLQFQRMAHELERLAAEKAPRLVASHIGSILFSLSCIRHSFQHSSLQQLAARLVADDCQRLRLCGERDIVNIVKGMQAQGYANPLFWERLALAVAPLVPSLGPEAAAALLLYAPSSPPACAELAAAAAQRLRGHLPQLSRTTAVNVAHHLNRIHTLSHRLPAASTALGAAIPPLAAELSEVAASEGYLDALPAKQAALLISALDRLGAPRAASSPAGDAAAGGEAEAEAASDTLRAAAAAATAAADPTAAVGGLSPAVCEAVGRWVTLRVPLTPPPPTPAILAPTFPAASLALALRSSVGASSRLQLRHVAGIASALAASGYRNDEVYSRLAFYCLGLMAQQDASSATPRVLGNLQAAFQRPQAAGAAGAQQLVKAVVAAHRQQRRRSA